MYQSKKTIVYTYKRSNIVHVTSKSYYLVLRINTMKKKCVYVSGEHLLPLLVIATFLPNGYHISNVDAYFDKLKTFTAMLLLPYHN